MIPYRGSAQHFNRTVFSRRLPPQADYSVKKAIRPLLTGYFADYHGKSVARSCIKHGVLQA